MAFCFIFDFLSLWLGDWPEGLSLTEIMPRFAPLRQWALLRRVGTFGGKSVQHQHHFFMANKNYTRLEDVIGCKWSVSVLTEVGRGINRPGALERAITGISTKILSERLRRLTLFELLNKKSFAEVPPRVEYTLTPLGRKLLAIIQQIDTLSQQKVARPKS
jgi:DNA-binding HxlR family transcriptional regulator